jgi:hypothetical protein
MVSIAIVEIYFTGQSADQCIDLLGGLGTRRWGSEVAYLRFYYDFLGGLGAGFIIYYCAFLTPSLAFM